MPSASHSGCALTSVLFTAVALHAGAARGAVEEVAVLRSYEAPGDCPSATTFMHHFASRTQRVRITSSSAAAHLTFVVTLVHEDGHVVGRLVVASRGGMTSRREVSAQSCDEVVPALAFVAALAADPSAQPPPSAPTSPSASTSQRTASAQPVPSASGPGAPNAPTSPSASISQQETSTQPARSDTAAPNAPASQLDARPGSLDANSSSAVPPASRAAAPSVIAPQQPKNLALSHVLAPHGEGLDERWRWMLTGQFGAISGPSPTWSPFGALFVELQVPRLVWVTRGRVSLGLVGALPDNKDTHPGSVDFQWLTAATGVCPAVIGLSDQWSMAPCVLGELGILRGAASGISNPGERTRWWRAAGGAIQLRWSPKNRYFLHSEAALLGPLARDEFGIVKEGEFASVHKVPSIVGRVGFGVGLFL